MALTNLILTVAGVSAVILLMRSDVKQSASIFKRNVRQIRHWLEEESASAAKYAFHTHTHTLNFEVMDSAWFPWELFLLYFYVLSVKWRMVLNFTYTNTEVIFIEFWLQEVVNLWNSKNILTNNSALGEESSPNLLFLMADSTILADRFCVFRDGPEKVQHMYMLYVLITDTAEAYLYHLKNNTWSLTRVSGILVSLASSWIMAEALTH